MGNYSHLADLSLSEDGDFEIDGSGDLAMSYGLDCLEDDVRIRLNTNAPDWFHHRWLGATLEDFIGEPNTKAIGEMGRDRIYDNLTRDGKIRSADLNVHVTPINESEILYYIIINGSHEQNLNIPFSLKLE